jgi:hypothetical protein
LGLRPRDEEKVIEEIKDHIERHKVLYSCIGVGIVTAGITCLIMKGRHEGLGNAGPYGLETADTSVTMRPFSFLSQQKNTVEVIAREGRGHPGYVVHCLETNEYFPSQHQTSSVTGISEMILSRHLNGLLPNAQGLHFERIRVA